MKCSTHLTLLVVLCLTGISFMLGCDSSLPTLSEDTSTTQETTFPHGDLGSPVLLAPLELGWDDEDDLEWLIDSPPNEEDILAWEACLSDEAKSAFRYDPVCGVDGVMDELPNVLEVYNHYVHVGAIGYIQPTLVGQDGSVAQVKNVVSSDTGVVLIRSRSGQFAFEALKSGTAQMRVVLASGETYIIVFIIFP